jgi:hypothetical protein
VHNLCGGDEMNNFSPLSDRDSDARWTDSDGIQMDQLMEHDRLSITTANSTYEVTVVDPVTAQIMVCGGHYFPQDTLVYLAGSSLNSSTQLHGIQVGYCIEFIVAARRVKTSPVCSIRRLLRESDRAA